MYIGLPRWPFVGKKWAGSQSYIPTPTLAVAQLAVSAGHVLLYTLASLGLTRAHT